MAGKRSRSLADVLIDDDEAKAITDAVLERFRERNRRRQRSATRTARKQEARRRRNEQHAAQSTVTFPLHMGIPSGLIGSVTLRVDALASALVEAEQRRISFQFPAELKKWQQAKRAHKFQHDLRPHAATFARAMPRLLETYLDGFTENWTRGQMLQRLEEWPKEDATRALALPTVQSHIAAIRKTKGEKGTTDRERLQRVLARITTSHENRGRRPNEEPVSASALAAYDAVLPHLKAAKRDEDPSSERCDAIASVLAASGVANPKDKAKTCINLLFKQDRTPSRATLMIIAGSFDGQSARRLAAAVRARTQN